MKALYPMPIVLLAILLGCSQQSDQAEATTEKGDGISFVHTRLADAVELAQAADKMILVDVYATWCGPCKQLDKIVFQDSEVGSWVNSRFVGLKVDGEKDEGPELMEKWGIRGYPTVLILDKDGNEIDRIVGFGGSKDEYMEIVEAYSQGIGTLTDLLAKIEEDPQDIELNYKLADKYYDREKTEKAIAHFQKVVEQDPESSTEFGTRAAYTLASIEARQNKNIDPMIAFVESTQDENYKRYGYSLMVSYYKRQDDQKKVFETYDIIFSELEPSAGMMNACAWYIFEEKLSEKYAYGIDLAKQAVDLEPEADHIWDTLAQLHFINGDVTEAIYAMEKAVELAPDEEAYKKLLAEYKKTVTIS